MKMPSSSSVLLHSPTSTIIRPSNPSKFQYFQPLKTRNFGHNSFKCNSRLSDHSQNLKGLDLYDLLGIEHSSDKSQIKSAYRALQKRCHPDIAGTAGHDMAIILNQAYSILSDPSSRSAYDKEQAKIADFRGYTGRPLYSTWFGSEDEERAVFVDEIKCVGCLKCALFAQKTFAVESVYGRARVVAQWADPEQKIHDAIQACPVDCISIVERSELAALEFLMSKQPRGNVKVGAGNSVGARVSNIFVDVKKFQSRYEESKTKSSKTSSIETEEWMSTIFAIRSISNWLYWRSPKTQPSSQAPRGNLNLIAEKSTQPSTEKLREAATARKMAKEDAGPTHKRPSEYTTDDQYWKPLTALIPPPISSSNSSKPFEPSKANSELKVDVESKLSNPIPDDHGQRNPWMGAFPLVAGAFAAVIIRLQVGSGDGVGTGGGLEKHVAGSLVLDIVNSMWLQTILAGVTWYLIGVAIVELIEVLKKGNVNEKVHDK
ncbi:hypothetical protein Syun_022331 [Stephania yunnanensis]|uniref:J domain-containing protein n=1 Tax=Stephania yunnanensis TaxID=152371 RepID=A0AAP0I2T2_9MAGN